MRQSRRMSLIEAITNVAVGFALAIATQMLVFPLFGLQASLADNLALRQHARPGEVCYEPFSGSGSQIIAGETTGRRVFAIEISARYVDVAVKRWQTAAGKRASLDGDGRSFDEVAAERLPRAA